MPHKLIGLVAALAMAATAAVEGGLVWLLEPLLDEGLGAGSLQA